MAELLPLVEVVRWYAGGCLHLGSGFYASLLERMAADVEAGGPVSVALEGHERTSIEDALPLRLLGGVHRVVLEGGAPPLVDRYPSTGGDGDVSAAWPAFVEVLERDRERLRDILTRPPQTNEVGRSVALVGGLVVVSRQTQLPLRILELGTSAALNLRLDRYWYESNGSGVGDPGSPVRFVDRWSRPPPFEAGLAIAARRGCDRDPIDAATVDGRLTLLSYVWPDQVERLQLLRAALDVARHFPVPVDRAVIPEWLDLQMQETTEGVATVVFHSIVWQYLGDEERAAVLATLADAGRRATPRAPLAWVRLEPGPDPAFAELRFTQWPGGDERVLATASFHGGQVDWLG